MKKIVYFDKILHSPIVGSSAVVGGVHSHHTLSDEELKSHDNIVTTSVVEKVYWETETGRIGFLTRNTVYLSRKD